MRRRAVGKAISIRRASPRGGAGRACAAALALAAVATAAQLAPAATLPRASAAEPDVNRRPLVFVVVIDGLDGDSVDAGKAPFISSLLAGQDARATYFEESRAVIPASTNPNHTAMMTGAYPGASGIAGNGFALYHPVGHEDSCVPTGPLDLRSLPHYTSGESRTCPEAEMLFESVLRQGNPDELVTAGFFGKPKLGRIFSGHNVDPDHTDAHHLWAPCESASAANPEAPTSEGREYCEEVPTNPASGYAIDDATVMDAVIDAVEGGVPVGGETKRPDFSFVNLHQVDSAGHGFGRGSVYDQAVAMADDEIERLVDTLRSLGEWERTVLILLSDHSMDTTPQKIDLGAALEGSGVPESEYFVLSDESGDNGSVDLVYLADRKSRGRFSLLAKLRQAALAVPGVDEALYRKPNPADGGKRHTVEGTHPEWGSAGPRSGDLLVTATEGHVFAEIPSSAAALSGHHGAEQTRDNFFAVIGGSTLVRQRTIEGVQIPGFDDTAANPDQAENVDVAATVMGLFGLFAPADNEGRFLEQAFRGKVLREIGLPERPRLRVRDKRRGVALRFLPKGGTYDLKAHFRGTRGWEWLHRKTDDHRVRVKGKPGQRVVFRMRTISAAGVKSRWRRAVARL